MNGRRNSGGEIAARLVAPPVAVGLAWLLSVGNENGDRWLTLANAALAMAVLTVGAALVDWLAGVVTSVASAFALNYFHISAEGSSVEPPSLRTIASHHRMYTAHTTKNASAIAMKTTSATSNLHSNSRHAQRSTSAWAAPPTF